MTRFSVTMDEALDFILESTIEGQGSEIFIPKLRAYSIMDLKDALIELFGDTGVNVVGIRPGEKLHEILINNDEIRQVYEFKNKYIIVSPDKTEAQIKKTYSNIKKTKLSESYSSDSVKKMSKSDLKKYLSDLDL